MVGSLYPAGVGVDNPSSDSTLLVVELTITDWLPGVPFYFYAANEQNEHVTDQDRQLRTQRRNIQMLIWLSFSIMRLKAWVGNG